jgi:plasmid stability protein
MRHGRSTEAEVCAILVDAIREPDEGLNLAQAIMARLRSQFGNGRGAVRGLAFQGLPGLVREWLGQYP